MPIRISIDQKFANPLGAAAAPVVNLKCYVFVDSTWARAHQQSLQPVLSTWSRRPPLLTSVCRHDVLPGRHSLRVCHPYLWLILSLNSLRSSYRQTCNCSAAYVALVFIHTFCSRSKFWWGYTYRWISSAGLSIGSILCSSKIFVIFYSYSSFLVQFNPDLVVGTL